jgi:N utilization substance protein B
VWELRTQPTPKKIVINEAILLAKEFAAAESPRFINGVLDAVARRLRGDAGGEAGEDSRDSGDAENC